MQKRLIIGMSGASGLPVGIELLQMLKSKPEWESHLVLTDSAKKTLAYESDISLSQLLSLATVTHDFDHIGASIASGSFVCEGMIIVPCSMKTLAGIACGYADNLLLRAADVTIKERRKLVLMVRECPLSTIHLQNMARLAQIGVDIFPLMMTFYNRPQTIGAMSAHLAAHALLRFGIETAGCTPWEGGAQ